MPRETERIGRSGEYLACSVLARESDTVTIMPHTSHADVIFEWKHKLYRCQVKTVTHIEKTKKNWRFDIRKGITTTGRHYKKNQIDIIAMVNLKYQTVCFRAFSDCQTTQITIKDEIMKSINSIESLKEAMESIVLATDSRQGKNESTSGAEKTAING
jgi:adenine-specific DNA methylase